MTDSLTLTLPRPETDEGRKITVVTWNGHIETTETRGEPMPVRSFLFDLDGEQRAARLAQLRERLR